MAFSGILLFCVAPCVHAKRFPPFEAFFTEFSQNLPFVVVVVDIPRGFFLEDFANLRGCQVCKW